MSIFIIDHENVQHYGLKGIDRLEADDEVIIIRFDKKLPPKVKTALNTTSAKIEYIEQKIHTRNSLDFKCVSYAGVLGGKNPGKEIVLISKDSGFRSAVELLDAMLSNKVILCEDIECALKTLKRPVKTTPVLTPSTLTTTVVPRTKSFYRKVEAEFRLRDNPKSDESKLVRNNIQKILISYGGAKLGSSCEVARVAYMISENFEDFKNYLKVRKVSNADNICKALKKHYSELRLLV